ncbi:isochorismatase family protein [Glycomyces sp. TRM65418]|uniref:isochorismatase family protein n=1 Tax=Glycomyces sp. TRM65418 TaxID=2867006 RepID=UPI001CE58A21|nr:isochorismatase family protein [Glycomyces sp. TRM65418]MCC3761599.1 isochorismatase family protein [Glycomyces sp. TRM65418]QZD55695.1 isochorismatase family protein [Glycomyces sp. TRM65418]
MTIPAIAGYRIPESLPPNAVEWRPEPDRAVLLVHDMQQYFMDKFPSGAEPASTVVSNIALLQSAARSVGAPVAFTAQRGDATPGERGLLRDFWGPGMSADPAHTRIVRGLEPGPEDLVLRKHRYSAFHRTNLSEWMAEAGRDQLIVCGVYAHIGCLMTAFDAFSNDIQPFLVADAVADFTAEDHRLALELAARRCAAVVRSRDVEAALVGSPAALTNSDF